MTQWLPVVGYEGRYEVSDDGRIRSVERTQKHWNSPRLKTLLSVEKKQCFDSKEGSGKTRYLQVCLCAGSRKSSKSFKVHILVARAFHGPRPDGMQVRHLDGNSLNNTAGNLQYGTHQENMDDRAEHGNHKIYGADNKKSKLSPEQVIEIRSCSTPGIELAKRFGVTKQSIYQIRWGKVWRHLLPNTGNAGTLRGKSV